jgi:hypothetical protein
LRHCPECSRAFPPRFDVCPQCWAPLGAAPPGLPHQLALLLETNALFEADLLEELLRREGIPCVRVPCCIALSPGTGALTSCRLYVRADMAAAATELAAAILGREVSG